MIIDPYDPYVEEHHPTCKGGCGQLADECMCSWSVALGYSDAPVLFVVRHDEEEAESIEVVKK